MKFYQCLALAMGGLFILSGCAPTFNGTYKDHATIKPEQSYDDKSVRESYINTAKSQSNCLVGIQFFYRKGSIKNDSLYSSVQCLIDSKKKWHPINPNKFILFNKKGYYFKRRYLCKDDKEQSICRWNGNLQDGLVLNARIFSIDSEKTQLQDFFDVVTFHYNGNTYKQLAKSVCNQKNTCEIKLDKFIKSVGRYPAYSEWRLELHHYGEEALKNLQEEGQLYEERKKTAKNRGKALLSKLDKITINTIKAYDKALHDELICYKAITKHAYNNTLTAKSPTECANTQLGDTHTTNWSYWAKGDVNVAPTKIKELDKNIQQKYMALRITLINQLNSMPSFDIEKIKSQKDLLVVKLSIQSDRTWRSDLGELNNQLKQFIEQINQSAIKSDQQQNKEKLNKIAKTLLALSKQIDNVLKIVNYIQNVDQLYTVSSELYIIGQKKAKLLIENKKERYKLAIAVVNTNVPNQKEVLIEREANPPRTGLEQSYVDGIFVDSVQMYFGIAWNAIPVSPFNNQLVSEVGIENAIPIVDVIGWRFQNGGQGFWALFNDIRISPFGLTVLYEESQNGNAIFNPAWVTSIGLRSLRVGAGLALFNQSYDNFGNTGDETGSGFAKHIRFTVGVDLFKLFTSQSTGTVSKSDDGQSEVKK